EPRRRLGEHSVPHEETGGRRGPRGRGTEPGAVGGLRGRATAGPAVPRAAVRGAGGPQRLRDRTTVVRPHLPAAGDRLRPRPGRTGARAAGPRPAAARRRG